ncbi:MAG: right-handed parallel beta-helix repeat-containing protein, partial [Bacteroidota bacterium]|nr:right-handed parallel beta-helix repeat-containing protein [Bacteroidota bacterium]
LVGDASTYSGITVNPGASNVSILNNDISGMALSNPGNSSPLSYGILCWGNADPINSPSNILIDGNEIHGVSGTAISLGDNTESVTVSNNHFYGITQVLVNGAPWSSGVVAGQANNLAISGNDMDGLGYASVLTACTGVTLDLNQYTSGTSVMLLASLPNSILPDVTEWWSLEAAAIGYIYYFNSAAAQAATDAGLQAVGIPTVLSSSNPGCLDATACNYDADALTDDGTCAFPANEHVDCDGNCIADADGDGVCDGLEVSGCTNATACNYSNTATDDNGSCSFCCGETSSDNALYGLEQEIVAFDGIPGMRTYRFYITTPNADDLVSAVSGDENNPTIVSTTTSFYQDELGGAFPNGINPTLYDAFPSLQYDSWMTIGIDQAPDLAGGESAIGFAEAESWTTEFENGESFAIDGFFGGAWYATSDFTNGVSGEDQRVLLAQLTTDGELSGQFYVQVFPNGESEGLGDLVMLSFGPHVDTVAPSFVDFPADVTVGCDDALPTADIQAEDLCSELSVSLEEVTSGDGCLTTVARTYTATDAAGNSTSSTWTISVVDDAAPVFSAPADITVNCGDDISPASLGEVTSATDCNGYTISFNDATMFEMDPCIGEKIARTWRVADDCGNEAIDIQIITIVDAAAPSFAQVPADTTISCDAVVPTSDVVAQDDCGSVTVSSSDETLDGECAGSATILRTFTAVDPCGNNSQYVQTITVIDTVAPVFTSVPADLTVGVYDDMPSSSAEASDNCSNVTVLQSEVTDASANDFALVIRTFTAVDACGNSTTATQTITVLEALGCTDAFACNYDAVATADDGSCDYCSCDGVYPANGLYNLDIDTIEDGIDGMTTYQVYVTLESADDFLSAVTGDSGNPTYIRTSTSFHQDPLGAASAHGINGMLYDAFPPLVY